MSNIFDIGKYSKSEAAKGTSGYVDTVTEYDPLYDHTFRIKDSNRLTDAERVRLFEEKLIAFTRYINDSFMFIICKLGYEHAGLNIKSELLLLDTLIRVSIYDENTLGIVQMDYDLCYLLDLNSSGRLQTYLSVDAKSMINKVQKETFGEITYMTMEGGF